jgi:hypothetical protein
MDKQAKLVLPLTREEAAKALGVDASKADVEQAQKLFTCEHGVTLNWKQARQSLGLW